MVYKKYNTIEEAKAAQAQQKLNWKLRYGIENYKKLVREHANTYYKLHRSEINLKMQEKRKLNKKITKGYNTFEKIYVKEMKDRNKITKQLLKTYDLATKMQKIIFKL